MNDCWKILELEPTEDLDHLKRSYRELLKKYHPDRVTDPQMRELYTIKCAQINNAYKEATRRIKKGRLLEEETDQAGQGYPYDQGYSYGSYYGPVEPWYKTLFRFFIRATLVIGVIWALALAVLYYFMSRVD